ncbi:MAG TPA: sigma-70 family RNA polymerase sigma factor [Solirubrobacterales bacterium]|nr:sigma-70 family RNA polymerase sigma factor [Solirubrobacterales bacterium]
MPQGSTIADALPRDLAEQRFGRLYRDHARDILGYVLRRCTDPEDAADAVAETFLTAWRRLPEVPLGGEGRLWLYGTARFVIANQQRGERRRTRLAEQLRAELRRQLPAGSAVGSTGILEALGALNEPDRELLMLVGWEELTPAQAARVLGVTPLAARSRLHRARRRLRARLEELGDSASLQTELEAEEAGR